MRFPITLLVTALWSHAGAAVESVAEEPKSQAIVLKVGDVRTIPFKDTIDVVRGDMESECLSVTYDEHALFVAARCARDEPFRLNVSAFEQEQPSTFDIRVEPAEKSIHLDVLEIRERWRSVLLKADGSIKSYSTDDPVLDVRMFDGGLYLKCSREGFFRLSVQREGLPSLEKLIQCSRQPEMIRLFVGEVCEVEFDEDVRTIAVSVGMPVNARTLGRRRLLLQTFDPRGGNVLIWMESGRYVTLPIIVMDKGPRNLVPGQCLKRANTWLKNPTELPRPSPAPVPKPK